MTLRDVKPLVQISHMHSSHMQIYLTVIRCSGIINQFKVYSVTLEHPTKNGQPERACIILIPCLPLLFIILLLCGRVKFHYTLQIHTTAQTHLGVTNKVIT